MSDEEAERRRYALLQAAAVIWTSEGSTTIYQAVSDAASILAEIERREKETE